MQERFRKQRYDPRRERTKHAVETKFPWEEEKAVIKPQASSLSKLTTAIARHNTEYNPDDPHWSGQMFIDPAVFSDEEIKTALGLPESFDVQSFRTNPALLDSIQDARERLKSYGVDLFNQQTQKEDEDRSWWREAAATYHKYYTGPALELVGKAAHEIFYPARAWNTLIKEAENLDRLERERLDNLAAQIERLPQAYPKGKLEQEQRKVQKGFIGFPEEEDSKAKIRYVIGNLMEKVGSLPIDLIMGEDSAEDIAEFQARMAPAIETLREDGKIGTGVAVPLAVWTGMTGATIDPEHGGFRFATPESWLGSVAMAYHSVKGQDKHDIQFDKNVDLLMGQGHSMHEARAAAFYQREDISQKVKVATTILSDQSSYMGLPPIWKAAKIPGALYSGTVKGLRYSNQAVGRIPHQPFRMFKGGLVSEEDALARLNTNRSVVGSLVNRVPGSERFLGVANQISRWKVGDIRRTVTENLGLDGIWTDDISKIMSQTMQGFRAFGDFTLVQPGKQMRRRLLKPWQEEMRSGLEIVNDVKSSLHLTFAPGRVYRRQVPRPTSEAIREKAKTMFEPFRSEEFVRVGSKSKYQMRYIGEETLGGETTLREAQRMVDRGEIDRVEDAEGFFEGYIERYEVKSANGKETWEIEVTVNPFDVGADGGLDIYRTTTGPGGFRRGVSAEDMKAPLPMDVQRDAISLLSRSEHLKDVKRLKSTRGTTEYVQRRVDAGLEDPVKPTDYGLEGTLARTRVDRHTAARAARELKAEARASREPVYWRDVFERPGDFVGITTREMALIKDIQHWYKGMRQYALSEGVDIKELGSLEEGFSFVSAKVKGFKIGKTGKDAQKEYVTLAEARPKPTTESTRRTEFRKSRLKKTMEESVKTSGTDYFNPFETIEAYGTSVLNEVKLMRLRRRLGPHLRGTGIKEVYPELYKAKEVAGKGVRRQRDLIKLVNQFKRDLIPHSSQISSLKRWFPTLSDDIDEAMGFTGDRWRAAIRTMNAMSEAGKFPKPVIEALQAMHFQTNLPKLITRKEVHQALKAASLDAKSHRAMVTQVMRMIGEDFKQTRVGVIDALMDNMKQLQPAAKANLEEIQKSLGHKADLNRSPLYGERESTAFKGYIWTGDRAEWAWSKTEAFMAPANKWYDNTVLPLNSLIRSLKTVADFGSPITHGLPLLFNNPEKWAFATTMHLRAFGDDGVKARYLADNADEVSLFLKNGMHLGSTEMTEAARDSGTLARVATVTQRATEKVPLLGRDTPIANRLRTGINAPTKIIELGGRRFSSSFEGFLDIARIEIMKGLKETAMRSKNPERAMIEVAEFANKMTGVTSTRALGIPVGQRALEGAAFFFSPRYTRALVSLFMDMTRGGLKGELARNAMGHLFMGQIATHVAVSAMLQQDVNLIPGPGFLKNRILGDDDDPGMMIGPSGKANSLVNMLGDSINQGINNPQAFSHVNVFSQKTYDENDLLKRMRYMTSPLLQEAIGWTTGADAIGRAMPDPTDIKEMLPYFGTRFAPFAVEAAVEAGINKEGTVSFFAESAGGMTSPVSAYTQRDDLRDKYTLEDYGPEGNVEPLNIRTYEELKAYHRHRSLLAGMERRHPELLEWSKKATKQSEEFARNDEKEAIEQKLTTIRTEAINGTYNEQGALVSKGYNQIGEEFERSPHERAGANFQKAFWGNNKSEQARKHQVKLEHKSYYSDRAMYFDDTEPANLAMAAAEDFMDFYLSPQARDEFGNLNHPAVDRKLETIEQDMRLSLMEDGMSDEEATRIASEVTLENEEQYIERFLKTPEGQELHPKVVRFIQGFPLVDKYHSVYKEVLPPEDHTKYKVFMGSSWAVKQQLLTQPEYIVMDGKVGRAQEKLRRENYEIDSHMVMYYDMAPVNLQLQRETRALQREARENLR